MREVGAVAASGALDATTVRQRRTAATVAATGPLVTGGGTSHLLNDAEPSASTLRCRG
jgi:hypothetical protein